MVNLRYIVRVEVGEVAYTFRSKVTVQKILERKNGEVRKNLRVNLREIAVYVEVFKNIRKVQKVVVGLYVVVETNQIFWNL